LKKLRRLALPLLFLLLVRAASAQSPLSVNVIKREDPGRDWSCSRPSNCTADYYRFIELAADHARPISGWRLFWQMNRIRLRMTRLEGRALPESELRDRIIDGLNIGFLLDGFDPRPLTVATTARRTAVSGYEERSLLFDDPLVGQFKALLLLPQGQGFVPPVPAVIAIHGHSDDAVVYRDQYHGADYPGRDYAILILTMRAMSVDRAEHAVSKKLLRHGFTLAGLHVYETLLGLKYLRHLAGIDPERIGLIGHSGGSSIGDLTIRIEPRFAVFVTDHAVNWYRSAFFELYHCETVPALYPIHKAINNFSTARVPTARVPYGYARGMAEVFAALDKHLKPARAGTTTEPGASATGPAM